MTGFFKLGSDLHGPEHQLRCCLCGETDREKLLVEDIGIAVGMSGDDYSFCENCWHSPRFGTHLLAMLGYPNGMKLRDECVVAMEM